MNILENNFVLHTLISITLQQKSAHSSTLIQTYKREIIKGFGQRTKIKTLPIIMSIMSSFAKYGFSIFMSKNEKKWRRELNR
jgi:hypothetical protein